MGRKRTDYVLLREGSPIHVIEVKKAVRRGREGWAGSPDLQQVRSYANELGVSATLIDANRLSLIGRGADRPHLEVERHTSTAEDLDQVRKHLLGRG